MKKNLQGRERERDWRQSWLGRMDTCQLMRKLREAGKARELRGRMCYIKNLLRRSEGSMQNKNLLSDTYVLPLISLLRLYPSGSSSLLSQRDVTAISFQKLYHNIL